MKIRFYPCGTSDLIYIVLPLQDMKEFKILIDSGYARQYKSFLKPLLETIDKIDLWIITHSDLDHIGGLGALLMDKNCKELISKINKFWFNWSSIAIPLDETIGVKDGIFVRDKLIELGKLDNIDIDNSLDPFVYDNISIHIIAPSENSLKASKVKWIREEITLISSRSDWSFSSKELIEKKFEEDQEVWNAGSIAVLIEQNEKRALFLADSLPSVIVERLKKSPYHFNSEKPMSVDIVKVSHHGSHKNTSIELVQLIDCENWVITANGNGGKPSKEGILRIISERSKMNKISKIYINSSYPAYSDIFLDDVDAQNLFKFDFINLIDGIIEI
ncbi:MAG: MBL fold metallo-hydrolase [Saprospiraceae bacterium]|nr:MBL fold metallo-hydrolase [Saprospiraceae bacterium]MBK8853468.1 MBL fold metallo-hydrolase [Saprospiraceae bacterium]MBK9041955.1 MBL fold metallo-hydrolase [Saprospiraceae bacterium]